MKQVGKLEGRIIKLLGLKMPADLPIYIGESNIQHMKSKHPADYDKYGMDIPEILSSPDYVRANPRDGSIEYVKEYQINNDFVKVAVRVAGSGKLYARSLYILNRNRVNGFIEKGTLKKT